jgi:hypothetical protein
MIMSLQSKLAYRRQKLNWCLENGRVEQAEWNRQEVARLEKLVNEGHKADPIESEISDLRHQIENLKLIDKNDPNIFVLYGKIGHLRSIKNHWSAK